MQNFGVYPGLRETSDKCMQSLRDMDWESIRIHVDTRRLVAGASDPERTMHFINNVIHPVVDYIQKSIKVRRRFGRFERKHICGDSSECEKLRGDSFCAEIIPAVELPHIEADVVVVVTSIDGRSSDVLASSLGCAFDVCDRPIYGRMNISPLTINDPYGLELNELHALVLHELSHILVFHLDYFPLFRFSNGTPRVRRKEDGLPSRVYYDGDYSGDSYRIYNFDSSTPQPYSIMSTAGVLELFNERGVYCECSGDSAESWRMCLLNTTHGPCLGKIVTETVVEKTREYFNCSTLTGAELENKMPERFQLFSSHWSRASLKVDGMNSFLGQGDEAILSLSNITLALYEDSGWYKADYSKSWKAEWGRDEGYLQGCGFFADDLKSQFSQSFASRSVETASVFQVLYRLFKRLF